MAHVRTCTYSHVMHANSMTLYKLTHKYGLVWTNRLQLHIHAAIFSNLLFTKTECNTKTYSYANRMFPCFLWKILQKGKPEIAAYDKSTGKRNILRIVHALSKQTWRENDEE